MCNAGLKVCRELEIPRPRDATELTMTAWSSWAASTSKQNRILSFFLRYLINDISGFCSRILLAINLQCHVFFAFEKLSLKSVFVCKRHFWWRQKWRHLHVTMLKCLAKFSDVLIRWSIRMILAKNYETVFKFLKVMPWKLVASFFLDTV